MKVTIAASIVVVAAVAWRSYRLGHEAGRKSVMDMVAAVMGPAFLVIFAARLEAVQGHMQEQEAKEVRRGVN